MLTLLTTKLMPWLHRWLILGCFLYAHPWLSSYAANNSRGPIVNYRPIFLPVQDREGHLQIVIRLFNQENELFALLVDPYRLTTSSAKFATLVFRKQGTKGNMPGYFTWQELAHTPYMQLVHHCTTPPYPLQNDGIKHTLGSSKGYFLTVDMCPSARPFDQAFFEQLIAHHPDQHPIPIGIGLTGIWLFSHPAAFQWLCEQEQQKKIQITWINHTLRSQYYHDLPLEKNFLRFNHLDHAKENWTDDASFDIKEDILITEQLLLEQGQLPSIFFRFPGLISDQTLVHAISRLGLVPLGVGAWLAKNQTPTLGDILLVHANGNEPIGLTKFMNWLKGLPPKEVPWLPLTQLAP
eukprot:gene96-125_t